MSEEKKYIDPNSTDWKDSDIKVDPRFEVCKKEAIICLVIWFIFAFALLFCIFILGGGNPAEYKYICGMPAWYFVESAVCFISALAVWFLLNKVFRHMSLDADGKLE